MHRCLQLAKLGAGYTAPNPMVGAVLVYNDRIIGEGYHEEYGQPHAEVNCLASVKDQDRELIPASVLYVSLEPCSHFGKTPPCVDLIIKHNIPKVVIGCRDPFKQVDGKGIEKLKAAGVEVVTGIAEKEAIDLNKRFFCFHQRHRPYIILKWAETANGKIAWNEQLPNRLFISNEISNRLVHKWRSEEQAILIGKNTALQDDPLLTTRLWPGTSPLRLIIDMDLSLPSSLKVFNSPAKTIVFNTISHDVDENFFTGKKNVGYYQLTSDVDLVDQVVNALYHLHIQSVIVEGGQRLLQSFIDKQAWNEARVIRNEKLFINKGLHAPQLNNAGISKKIKIRNDEISTYFNCLAR